MATKPRRAHRSRETRFTETRERIGLSEIMTVEQVAEYLQLNKLTIYKYVREGRIPAAKLGKAYRIRKSDVDLFLERLKMRPARAAHTREVAQSERRPSRGASGSRAEEEVAAPYRGDELRPRDHNLTENLLDWMLRELH